MQVDVEGSHEVDVGPAAPADDAADGAAEVAEVLVLVEQEVHRVSSPRGAS